MTRNDLLLKLALNLNETLSSHHRYERVLDLIVESLPCDSACLMGKEGEVLNTLSYRGLDSSVGQKQFVINDHPRLKIVTKSKGPIVFPHDSQLPDPFSGLIAHDSAGCLDVHSCFGCPLRVEGEVVGVLVADALKPHLFDDLDMDLLSMISALAGATLRTSKLIDKLEEKAKKERDFAQSLVADVNKAREVPFLGVAPATDGVRKAVDIVGPSDFSILVTGETGVGKEIVARMIHSRSLRKHRPLIYVNCAALPENIAESELFGHVRGSFTGAVSDRLGKFQLAEGGTLFLDEIGELPLSIQAKLLRALQEGEIQKVGSDKLIKVDLRIIAATNRDLEKEVELGRFRSDLYHRLNVYPLRVPPLRERVEDVPILLSYYGDMFQKRLGTGPLRVTDEAMELLKGYAWPGNVRELKNALSRASLGARYKAQEGKTLTLTKSDFNFLGRPNDNEIAAAKTSYPDTLNFSLREATENFQKDLIVSRLQVKNNNWAQTAQSLGMHRSNLHHLAKKLGLK